jgi:hypothetical protein
MWCATKKTPPHNEEAPECATSPPLKAAKLRRQLSAQRRGQSMAGWGGSAAWAFPPPPLQAATVRCSIACQPGVSPRLSACDYR